jgi:hypothetical protein
MPGIEPALIDVSIRHAMRDILTSGCAARAIDLCLEVRAG